MDPAQGWPEWQALHLTPWGPGMSSELWGVRMEGREAGKTYKDIEPITPNSIPIPAASWRGGWRRKAYNGEGKATGCWLWGLDSDQTTALGKSGLQCWAGEGQCTCQLTSYLLQG